MDYRNVERVHVPGTEWMVRYLQNVVLKTRYIFTLYLLVRLRR